MHSILLLINEPATSATKTKEEVDKHNDWFRLCTQSKSDAGKIQEAQSLDINLLSIPANGGLPLFAKVIQEAGTLGLSCKVLFFEEAPKWIQV